MKMLSWVPTVSLVIGIAFMGCGGGNDVVENAEVLINLGKYDKALEVLDAALLENPKNIDIHLLKGRVYLGLGDMEGADDAFSDAIAVGGKSAARRIDDVVLDQYDSVLEQSFPPKDRQGTRAIQNAVGALGFLNDDQSKTKALQTTFEIALKQKSQDQDGYWYEAVYEAFVEKASLDEDVARTELIAATEEIAKRSKESVKCWNAADYLKSRHATQEERQKIEEILEEYKPDSRRAYETLESMRSIYTAIEGYAVRQGEYPLVNSIDSVKPLLEPAYISNLPTLDAWKNKFLVRSIQKGYLIVSPGADGAFESEYADPKFVQSLGETSGYEKDLIVWNGEFVQYPEGLR